MHCVLMKGSTYHFLGLHLYTFLGNRDCEEVSFLEGFHNNMCIYTCTVCVCVCVCV